MTELQAIILGLVQGLTEFLPVSSSGHLEIGNHLLKTPIEENLTFTVALHAATVLSTLVVFRRDIAELVVKLFEFRLNTETRFVLKLLLSAVPVAIIGFFFRDAVENLFTGNLLLVGCCLLLTALLLAFAHFRKGKMNREISWSHSFIIGIAQAIAVLPGLSRSGSTIATGLILGNERRETARFSFLMVIIPILGAVFLDLLKGAANSSNSIDWLPLLLGTATAFISGLLACKWMISIVSKGKLIYFALYCLLVGLIAIFAA